jgi:photosystem II protein
MKASIQFIENIDEEVIAEVKLTRSRDGSTGTATFLFYQPTILDKNMSQAGEITGMYMVDEEGTIVTRDVNARYINGKPQSIEAVYIMKNREAWDRFMRFMERYSSSNDLTFKKSSSTN